MSRPVRWVVTVLAAVLTFVLCLWAARSTSFSWLPKAETDRWVVATAFATLGATVVAAAVGWWAGQATAPTAGRTVTQKAKALGQGQISQVGGNQNASHTSSSPAPVTVRQEATAQDGSVHQVAGDQHTNEPAP